MSKISKFSLLFSGLFAVAVVVTRIILNGWIDAMWVPLGISVALFIFALFRDWRLMLEFFTLRTTKHGMSMGMMILAMAVFVGVVNFLAVQNEKKWDWTSEGLNSLAEQSVKAVENLKADTELVFLYRKGDNDQQTRRQVEELAQLYLGASKRLKFKAYNILERPDLGQKYEFTQGSFGFFVVQGEKHLKVASPTEEELTRTILRLAREKKKVVYFVSGHGELDPDLQGQESASGFKQDLELSYDVKKLELFKNAKVPGDAELVVVAGPRQAYLPAETEALREYAKSGGRLLLAIDPDGKHGLQNLTKTFGVEFENNYILDPRAMIPGAGTIAAIGSEFSQTAEATKPLRNGFVVFVVASSLKKSPDKATESFKFDELVKTDDTPIGADELASNPKVRLKGPHVLGYEVKGKLPGAEKEFDVIVYGDSDFFRNAFYRNNMNRDLAMNSVSSLAKDSDLVSIRPKAPKGTQLSVTNTQLMIVLFGFLLPVPILLFFSSGLLWWRRKAA